MLMKLLFSNGLHDYFVEHWSFDDDSRTVICAKN